MMPSADLPHPDNEVIQSSRWQEYINNNRQDFDFRLSTGSSSGSLPGFAFLKALVPTGVLLRHPDPRTTPFSGELSDGATADKGVNTSRISLTSVLKQSLKYAYETFNQYGWTPEKGQESIDQLNKNLSQNGRLEYLKTMWTKKLRIEHKRQQAWKTLTDTEKTFIPHPFPIVYAIIDLPAADELSRGYLPAVESGAKETTRRWHIDALAQEKQKERIAVFCPESEIKRVITYLKQKQLSVPVHPIEALKYLCNTRKELNPAAALRGMNILPPAP